VTALAQLYQKRYNIHMSRRSSCRRIARPSPLGCDLSRGVPPYRSRTDDGARGPIVLDWPPYSSLLSFPGGIIK
jgi:hypothetical protein